MNSYAWAVCGLEMIRRLNLVGLVAVVSVLAVLSGIRPAMAEGQVARKCQPVSALFGESVICREDASFVGNESCESVSLRMERVDASSSGGQAIFRLRNDGARNVGYPLASEDASASNDESARRVLQESSYDLYSRGSKNHQWKRDLVIGDRFGPVGRLILRPGESANVGVDVGRILAEGKGSQAEFYVNIRSDDVGCPAESDVLRVADWSFE